MHELSLAQALVDEVERIRIKEKAVGILSVTVVIGALSGVNREALEFVFPMVAEGTCLERAALEIHETPAGVRCEACGRETRPDLAFFRCGECGSSRVRIVKGREFLIQSVQIQCEEEETEQGGEAALPEKGEGHHV
jgi:hydrogenase nickel incorporation protein HypA/HybF